MEVFAGDIDGGAVGEVASLGEVHAEDGVAGLAEGEEDGEVGVRAAVGLDVRVLRAEELLGPLARDVLDDVDVRTAAVVAFSGVALGVLVGEDAARREEHGLRDDVFGGDELDVVLLAFELAVTGRGDLGIIEFQVFEEVGHGDLFHEK